MAICQLSSQSEKVETALLKSAAKSIRRIIGRNIPSYVSRLAVCFLPIFAEVNSFATSDSRIEIEGTVNSVDPIQNGGLELHLSGGATRTTVKVLNASGSSPVLSSRIRVTGDPAVEGNVSELVVSDLNQIQFLSGSAVPLAKDMVSLRRAGSAAQHIRCVAYLRGLVLANSGQSTFALQDDTGVALFEKRSGGPFTIPGPVRGQFITLQGNCVVEGDHVLFCDPPVVDNNDLHEMSEKSGTVFLSGGRHQLRLGWFNQEFPYGLEVYFQGPGLSRQRIPDSALFRLKFDPITGEAHWTNGLEYSCYEGSWLRVPDFDRLVSVKRGNSANFDTNVIPRVNDIGVQFSGYVDVPRGGLYTFTTISDDGSLMFIDEAPPVIDVTGTNALPEPIPITVHESLRAEEDHRWAQVEGTVTFVNAQGGALELELSSDTGRMTVEIADGSGASPQLLLNSRVRATGICLGTLNASGQDTAGRLLAPGIAQIEIQTMPAQQWSQHPIVHISSLAKTDISPDAEMVVHVIGKAHSSSGGKLLVDDETGSVQITTAGHFPHDDGVPIEVLGRWSRVDTNVVLRCAFCRETRELHDEAKSLPVLDTIEQIKGLPRGEWRRGYPVNIRGVITSVLNSGFFIQDSTRSIYARWRPPTDFDVPRVGEYWAIEGTTFAEFAPNIQVSQATRLGAGTLPNPLHPTWDQLINGSLDTEYIEVQGIISAIEGDEIILLTRAGKISLESPDLQTQQLLQDENALVRVRGCVIPVRDIHTQRVVPGRMRLSNASITVDEPAPVDPFAISLKHASDLLLFDSAAGAFQRVKVAGQIVHQGDGVLFLMDGSDGLRVIPKSTNGLRTGALAEVVGLPDLSGASPILREAVVHEIGDARLPDSVPLPSKTPLSRRYDATIVRVRARLNSSGLDHADQVLEMQLNTRGFVARLKKSEGLLPAILPGSLLELTGVYAGQRSDLTPGHEIDSFELLLNSPADVRVLARPSWWTVRHTLTLLGGMTFFVFASFVWIALLRRQVEERSNQLATEIRRHEHTERQRELEAERTRIAQDLHDDLGASLTQIRFLSAVESRDSQLPETTRGRMKQVSEKSREMVASLDEIVWAVNPANDSLPNLANYLCHFAEEFFRSTPVRCRLDVDEALPAIPLTAEMRHNLYLAVREALNNIARHSLATEIWLRVRFQSSAGLSIIIEDNGCGFTTRADVTGDGLGNMRQRLEKIGGRFELETRAGSGVVCRLILPVETAARRNGEPDSEVASPPSSRQL